MGGECYTPPEGLLGRAMRELEIAEKIWSGQRLTVKEKQDAYFFITGKKPPTKKKRGRPKEIRRDFSLALHYLHDKKKWKGKTSIFRNELRKQFKMEGCNDVTFYAALNRGIEDAHSFASEQIANPGNAIETWRAILKVIEEHKRKAEVKKKKGQ